MHQGLIAEERKSPKYVVFYAGRGKSTDEIAKLTGYSRTYLYQMAKELDIEFTRPDKHIRRPEIDRLLTGRYSMTEIARMIPPLENNETHVHVTRQRIFRYLMDTDQHEYFLRMRRRFLSKKRAFQAQGL